jgi:enamine deaminase RidA (YjgF/YER057c/UK114 family)
MSNDPRRAEISKATQEFWKENCPQFMRENNPPAGTAIGVGALGQAEWLIEIQVVAAAP